MYYLITRPCHENSLYYRLFDDVSKALSRGPDIRTLFAIHSSCLSSPYISVDDVIQASAIASKCTIEEQIVYGPVENISDFYTEYPELFL